MKIIILTLLFQLGFSQTQKETKQWIVDKYNDYERSNEYSSICDLDFKDSYMVVTMFGQIEKFPIKGINIIEIKSVRWNSDDKIGWTSMILRYGEDERAELLMNADFITEGYKTRMEKAIIHLVELYGGKAKIKKEAF